MAYIPRHVFTLDCTTEEFILNIDEMPDFILMTRMKPPGTGVSRKQIEITLIPKNGILFLG